MFVRSHAILKNTSFQCRGVFFLLIELLNRFNSLLQNISRKIFKWMLSVDNEFSRTPCAWCTRHIFWYVVVITDRCITFTIFDMDFYPQLCQMLHCSLILSESSPISNWTILWYHFSNLGWIWKEEVLKTFAFSI